MAIVKTDFVEQIILKQTEYIYCVKIGFANVAQAHNLQTLAAGMKSCTQAFHCDIM